MAKKASGGYPLPNSIKKELGLEGDYVKPTEERDGDQVGLANGLNLTHFLNGLFYHNFDEQLTDEELEEAMRTEFPNRSKFQTISQYRGYYNANLHGFGQGFPLEKEYRLRKVNPEKPAAKKEPKSEANSDKKGKPTKKKKTAAK